MKIDALWQQLKAHPSSRAAQACLSAPGLSGLAAVCKDVSKKNTKPLNEVLPDTLICSDIQNAASITATDVFRVVVGRRLKRRPGPWVECAFQPVCSRSASQYWLTQWSRCLWHDCDVPHCLTTLEFHPACWPGILERIRGSQKEEDERRYRAGI